jgi:hypothetical protein
MNIEYNFIDLIKEEKKRLNVENNEKQHEIWIQLYVN